MNWIMFYFSKTATGGSVKIVSTTIYLPALASSMRAGLKHTLSKPVMLPVAYVPGVIIHLTHSLLYVAK
jgi:hypothetical protein